MWVAGGSTDDTENQHAGQEQELNQEKRPEQGWAGPRRSDAFAISHAATTAAMKTGTARIDVRWVGRRARAQRR